MFNTPTTFILGAGASWHYGYPTGEELVKRVIAKASYVRSYFEFSAKSCHPYLPGYLARKISGPGSASEFSTVWSSAEHDADELAKRLKHVNPTVIDYFLKQNADLHEIGKLVIAMVLLDCEADYTNKGGNPNHQALHQRRAHRGYAAPTDVQLHAFDDDWIRFVLYKLTSRCNSSVDLLSNKVAFVTFNYDTSLERRLFRGLRNIRLFQEEDIAAFLSNSRILHVYGAVREKVYIDGQPVTILLTPSRSPAHLIDAEATLNACHAASCGIRTIDGPEKEMAVDMLVIARDAISRSEKLFILGYGFDETNNSRIGLTPERHADPIDRTVFLTNFGGHNRVSMAASRAFSGGYGKFLSPNSPIQVDTNLVQNIYRRRQWHMSTKNVYDALNEDFESLETD